MKNKKVIILHGYEGSPGINWFPWLKKKLEELDVQVQIPSMPDSCSPKLGAWLDYLEKMIGEPNEDLFLVGHSLGGPAIFRFLETLPAGRKIGGAVVVAGFAESIHADAVENFVNGQWNDEKIRSSSYNITLINSDNDPYIPMEMAMRMKNRFEAKLVVMHEAEHICEKAGFLRLPEALEELQQMMSSSYARRQIQS
jgi:uncharacterized protein